MASGPFATTSLTDTRTSEDTMRWMAIRMRGTWMTPYSCRRLKVASRSLRSPSVRVVVTPDSRSLRSQWTPQSATSASDFVVWASSSKWVCRDTWLCASTMPGTRVSSGRSMTRAPDGAVTWRRGPTASMRPLTTRTEPSRMGRRPVPSISHLPCTTTGRWVRTTGPAWPLVSLIARLRSGAPGS